MEHLFIFPDSVTRYSDTESIKLNIEGPELHFFHDGEEVIINTDVLRDGSSTMILNNVLTNNTYALYNFREILEVMDMTPSEFLHCMNQRGFMQIDKCSGKTYIKVFLLKGDNELLSDTNDFSCYLHYTKDYIHPLDWRYSWTLDNVSARLKDEMLILEFDLIKSDFWQRDIYVSHGGQYAKLQAGHNKIEFVFNRSENAYIGNPNCRYKGRAIDLNRLLHEKNDCGAQE